MKTKKTESAHTSAKTYKELLAKDLTWECPTSTFSFNTTKDLHPLNEIIGQDRAVEALHLGAKLASPGYNIFVSGLSGTGRSSTVKKMLEDVCNVKVQTYDYCYVNNFQNPDQPRLLKFKSGLGHAFLKAMGEAIAFLRQRIPQLFEEESFQKTRRSLVKKFQTKEKNTLAKFTEKISANGLVLGQLELATGILSPALLIPVGSEVHTIDELDELVKKGTFTAEQAKTLRQNFEKYQDDLADIIRAELKMAQEIGRALLEHDKLAAGVVVKSAFDQIRTEFTGEGAEILKYLADAEGNFLENIQIFSPERTLAVAAQNAQEESGAGIESDDALMMQEDPFGVYQVNLILDNTNTEFPPVIIETTPSFVNLFGTIEKKFDPRGFWKTDFTHIKGGALLRADGGYLILNALDMLEEDGVWKALKRLMLYRKLEIQPIDSFFQISHTTLKPEAIDVNVKIILIGDESLYQLLYFHEEDFTKIFKINANFDYEMPLSDDALVQLAAFTHKICDDENLLHFDKTGVAALVEAGVRSAGKRGWLTLKFSEIADIIRESSFYAQSALSRAVRRKDVEKALEKRQWRNNLLDEKIRMSILEGELLVATDGERIGQINGLTVYSTGLISFGKPARITASVGAGASGIINIEREVELSGSSHDKGVLILTGILRERFARSEAISLSASLAFEQSYGEIDGDSASCAETCVLLSALSEVPIRQSLAMTGSINQKGDIQPIGGVNEKIEGFFEICSARGLTGSQGVIIPSQNVPNLLLRKDVIQAVQKGKFHIYPIATLEEGIEILTGISAGTADADGVYPPESIFGKVQSRLKVMRKTRISTKESGEL